MRLTILDHGHRTRTRLFLSTVAALGRVAMADVPKMLLYRPEFAGGALLDLSAHAMRGPSYWTAGEREYMGMATAQRLRCPYCADTHAELVRIASAGELDAADPGSLRPELRAVLDLLDRVTGAPDEVSAADLAAVRERAVPDHAIVEALHVVVVWNIVNRLANAFGFRLREGQLEKGTRSLHRFGYRFPGFLTGPTRSDRDPATDGWTAQVERLRAAVLDGVAVTDPATRVAAATGGPLSEPLGSYAATVRDASYRVTDADIENLTGAGHSEDVIFEITVAAAVGAALHRLDAGLDALRNSP